MNFVSILRRSPITSRSGSCLRKLSAVTLALAVQTPFPALSQDVRPEVWLSPGFYSHHFDRSKSLRNENWGFGAELALTRKHLIMGGSFVNSNRTRSHYAGYQWRPLLWEVADLKVGADIAVAAFDGYPNYRSGAWFVAPLPVISVEGRYLGANFGFVPTIRDRLDGALVVQIKLRVY